MKKRILSPDVTEALKSYREEDQLRFAFAVLVSLDEGCEDFLELYDSVGFALAIALMSALGGRTITIPRADSFFGKAQIACAAIDVVSNGEPIRAASEKHKVSFKSLERAVEVVLSHEVSSKLFQRTSGHKVPNAEECANMVKDIHARMDSIKKKKPI